MWAVRGISAANSLRGESSDDHGYDDEAIEPPEGLTLVPVKGESMLPTLLDGQYAMVDKTREGLEVNGQIVVVVSADEDGNYLSRIKRCFRKGQDFRFTSINEEGNPPFDLSVKVCRIWPVIGVWFAGKGEPPKGFWVKVVDGDLGAKTV
jgi:phage repressor protein C with HTH and peptisase S24 domain